MKLNRGRLSYRAQSGFTLIELLTVIAIIGILTAIIIPVTRSVRAKARQAACASNLRQIGVAWQLYLNDNRGVFPSFTSYGMYNWGGKKSAWGGPETKDRPLYPYISDMKVFQCPADSGYSGSNASTFYSQSGNSYVMANSRERGILRRDTEASRQAISGVFSRLTNPSKTILVYEQTVRNTEAEYKNKTPMIYWHPNRDSNILMADGHIQVFRQSVFETYQNPTNPPGYTWGWSAWTAGSDWP